MKETKKKVKEKRESERKKKKVKEGKEEKGKKMRGKIREERGEKERKGKQREERNVKIKTTVGIKTQSAATLWTNGSKQALAKDQH